jgi:hypothetical protein
LESPVDLVSCRKSRRPCSIDPFPASQAEALDVEILLSSQGSRIVNVEKSSIMYSFLVRAHNLQSSESSKEVRPRSIEAFAKILFAAIAGVKRCTLSFSRFALHHSRLFRPLSPIVISVTTTQRHDVVLPSTPATVFTTPRPHELTLLSSVLSTPDTWMDKRPLQPRSDYKMEPLPRTADTKAPFPSELGIITVLVLLPASLGYTGTKASFHLLQSSRASCSPVFAPTSR